MNKPLLIGAMLLNLAACAEERTYYPAVSLYADRERSTSEQDYEAISEKIGHAYRECTEEIGSPLLLAIERQPFVYDCMKQKGYGYKPKEVRQ